MKLTWCAGVAVWLVLQPAITQAQTSLPNCGDAATPADSGAGDGAVGDAGDAGPIADAASCSPMTSPPGVDGSASPPSASPPGDGSAPTGPVYKGDPRPLDPMLADPPPFVEPPYAARDPEPSPSEPPAARTDAVDDTDHSQACGCRFVGYEQTSAIAPLLPLLGLLLLARRKLRCVSR